MPSVTSPDKFNLPFLKGGGEMGELIRSINWANTPLGHPEAWPAALRQTVSMMLTTTFPVLICWGEDYTQLYNDAFRPINGATKHPQAMGGSARDTYSEIWETIGPMFQEVMSGQSLGFPNFMVPLHRNGYMEDCYFDFSYSPIKDEDGTVRGVLVICMETSEKVRAIEQLVENEQNIRLEQDRLKSLFMQAPAGICILNGKDLIFELINPLYQQFFPGRQLLGKPLFEALPELKDTAILDIIQKVYQNGEEFEGRELKVPLSRTDGGPIEDRYFNFIYQPRINTGKEVDGILVFVMEVTDMILTRRRVQENADRFRTQMNAISQIAWTSTANGEVDFYNQKWYEYTGLDFQETKEWGWKKVIHPDDLDYNIKCYQEILEGGEGGEFEVRERRFDGIYRWHLVRILPIRDESSGIEHWMGTATDIHDLKMLQEHKDDFVSIASHELKTPVTGLKASLQILERMQAQPSPAILSKMIDQANRSVTKISQLIDILLDASKLNASQLHISKKPFRIYDLLLGCCQHVRTAGNHQLIIEGDTELQVVADEDRIEQVVVNFVNNAVKYAPESKEIYLIAEQTDDSIKISVRDKGPGIAPEKTPKLFNKYYRAELAGAQYSGLGLGLYISGEIIKRHNGKIGVDSELGKGSTFWFTLPL